MKYLIKNIAKIFLAVILYNWILAEVDIFLPGASAATQEIVNSIQLPTHEDILNDDYRTLDEIGSAAKEQIEKVNLASLDIDPSEVFDDQDLFDALRAKPILEEF